MEHRDCSSQQLQGKDADTCGLQLCQQLAPCVFYTPALLPSLVISTHSQPQEVQQRLLGWDWAGSAAPRTFPSSFPSPRALWELQHPGMVEDVGNPHGSAGRSSFPWKSRLLWSPRRGDGSHRSLALGRRQGWKPLQNEPRGIHSFRKGTSNFHLGWKRSSTPPTPTLEEHLEDLAVPWEHLDVLPGLFQTNNSVTLCFFFSSGAEHIFIPTAVVKTFICAALQLQLWTGINYVKCSRI